MRAKRHSPFTYDYRPRAVGGPALGYARAVWCARTDTGGMRFISQMWSFFKSDSDKSGALRTFLLPCA
jgi:hypothetical protein